MVEESLKFKDWLKLQGINGKMYPYCIDRYFKITQSEEFSQEKVNKFLGDLLDDLDEGSVNVFIKAFKKYCIYKNVQLEFPKLYKTVQKLPEHFDLSYLENEIMPMVGVIFQQKDKVKIAVLLYFMFYTGLRKCEYFSLMRKDIDIENKKVKIYDSKTKQERIVYFPDKVKDMLIAYFSSEPEEQNAFNITETSISYICSKLKPHGTINVHPHTLRHSFAINCLKSGIPLNIVSKLLGHKNIETTMRYLRLSDGEIEKFYRDKIQ